MHVYTMLMRKPIPVNPKMRVHSMNTKNLDAMVPKIRLAPRRYQLCSGEPPIHTSNSLFTGLGYAPSPRHLRSLLSAGGWFFVWSFVALFLSCRVLCGAVLVVCFCVACSSVHRSRCLCIR